MVNLAQAWAETYSGISSAVSVDVSGGGSGTGVAALINGTVDIANCSRQVKGQRKERSHLKTLVKNLLSISSVLMRSLFMCTKKIL